MQIDLPLDIFTYPDVPLPEVWTVEQHFKTPALTAGTGGNAGAACRRRACKLIRA